MQSCFLALAKATNRQQQKMWREVRLLVIDEISFMPDKQLNDLDRRLKEMRDRNKPFGGFSIIFAGDFRQLEPSGAKQNDLLFSR